MILLVGLLLTALTFADGKGHCVTLGECAVDDETGLTQPCVYDGNAVPLNDTDAIDYLKATCPDLDTGPGFSVCCSASQVNTFQSQLNTLAALFKRCPSCYHNIANIFCQLVCSPSQSEFLKVTKSSRFKTKQSVTEMDYYLTESFAEGLFNSCKNVQMSFTSNPAVGILCGGHMTDCNAHYWLEYMGGHDPSPYQINFHLEKTVNITVNGTVFHP
ncbi:Niemann-Pick C1 protein, partial [Stegodyphus mimosarum]